MALCPAMGHGVIIIGNSYDVIKRTVHGLMFKKLFFKIRERDIIHL